MHDRKQNDYATDVRKTHFKIAEIKVIAHYFWNYNTIVLLNFKMNSIRKLFFIEKIFKYLMINREGNFNEIIN